MKKGVLLCCLLLVVLLFLPIVLSDTVSDARLIIQERIPCANLSAEQLHTLGEYYMEVLQPKEYHDDLHERLGGENSSAARVLHRNLGLAFYCGESVALAPQEIKALTEREYIGPAISLCPAIPQKTTSFFEDFFNCTMTPISWVLLGVLVLVLIVLFFLVFKLLRLRR